MPIEVKDMMGRVAIAVRQDTAFADIVATMQRFKVSAVTVLNGDRRPVGVVSEDDLLLKEHKPVHDHVWEKPSDRAEFRKMAGVIAGELMTIPAITVTPGTPLRDAARLMHDKKIRQMPVVDPVTGRMVGTLHQSDVLRVFTRPSAELLADVKAAISDGTATDPATLEITTDRGIVTLRGRVRERTEAREIVTAVHLVDGVVDVASELRFQPAA